MLADFVAVNVDTLNMWICRRWSETGNVVM